MNERRVDDTAADRRPTGEGRRPGDPPGRPQRGPFVTTCPPGKYAHCQCQRSATYPYCDGSHRALAAADGSGPRPIKVVIDRTHTVTWCACGHSAHMPFCDGSHADS